VVSTASEKPPPNGKRLGSPIAKTCPFQKAVTQGKRLKLFLWGDSGSGKTTLSIQFPGAAVIDLEDGTAHYSESFAFDVLKVTEADDITAAVDWLLRNSHSYRTLVVDPITLFWDALQKKWSDIFLRRNKGQKGYKFEYYDMGPRDWMAVKAEFKAFIRKLIQLDMNVIVTARQKAQYADSGFMRVIGKTFDGEKSLPYMFDSILRLYRDDKGGFMAENLKDRSNKLPHGNFEVSYERLERCLGSEALARKAEPLKLATPEQLKILRQFISVCGISEVAVTQRLAAYGADSLERLSEENAQLIIEKFKKSSSANLSVAPTLTEERKNAED